MKFGIYKKPYEEKTRSVTLTIPNCVLDRLAADIEAKGERSMSAKVSEILAWWIAVALDGEDPALMVEAAKPGGAAEVDIDIEHELQRFKGFSSSPYVK